MLPHWLCWAQSLCCGQPLWVPPCWQTLEPPIVLSVPVCCLVLTWQEAQWFPIVEECWSFVFESHPLSCKTLIQGTLHTHTHTGTPAFLVREPQSLILNKGSKMALVSRLHQAEAWSPGFSLGSGTAMDLGLICFLR